MIGLDAQQDRRRALWRVFCRCGSTYAYCRCLAVCEGCGHVRGQHATDEMGHSENCDVSDCGCERFTEDDE